MTDRPDAEFFLDRRRHPRLPIERHMLTYHHDLAHGGEGLPAQTTEISPAAVAFLAEEPLDSGADLRLRIQIPFKQTFVRAAGRVVGCTPAPDGRWRVVATYHKLLSGSDEALYDTVLELLSR